MRTNFMVLLVLLAAAFAPAARGQEGNSSNAEIVADFSNPGLFTPHWTLTLHKDGSGHFRSERSQLQGSEAQGVDTPNVDRDVQLSAEFADRVFRTAEQHHWFNEACESHIKVAFQGWKKLSYQGPEGRGSCTFNYSRDKEIQALGDQLMGVAETMLEGARLETLLQHDPLGLDKETEFMVEAAKDGRLRQIGVIRPMLEKLEGDPAVLDRVRRRVRVLLALGER